jgi:GntR family transcriptional regulator
VSPSALLTLRVDPADPTPLHFKLRSLLRDAIQSLEYPSGSQLPPERDMATLYGVGRVTVRRALDALMREGLIRRTRGRTGGTFVQGPTSGDSPPAVVGGFNVVLSPRKFRRIEIDAFDIRASSPDVAQALYLTAGTPILYVERRLFGALGTVAFVRNVLPLSIGERLDRRDLRTMTLYDVLTQKLKVKIAEVRDEVEAVLAVRSVAKRLGIKTGTAILSIRRVYFTAGDEPVNLTQLLTRSDRYKTSVRLRENVFE